MQRVLKDGDWDKVMRMHEELIEAGRKPNLASINCVVGAKAALSSINEAREMLNLLKDTYPSITPNALTYCQLLKHATDDKQAVAELLEEMGSLSITPTVEVYNEMIGIYCAAKDYDGAAKMFAEMRSKDIQPSKYSFYRFINGCFKGGEADHAFRMLETMENEWRIPDAQAYDRMQAHFAHLKHREGQMRCLTGLFELEAEEHHSAVLEQLMRQAVDRKSPESIVVLQEFALSRDMKVSLSRFQRIGLIYALLQFDKPVEAFDAAVKCLADNHALPASAAKMLPEGLAKQVSFVDDAYFLLDSRNTAGEPVPLKAVNIVIEACASMSDLDRAFATWAELERLSLKPDVSTYNALLLTCLNAREPASGRRLLNRMKSDEIVPDADTFSHRCSLHVMNRQPEDALQVYHECKAADLVPPWRMFVTLINSALRRRKMPLAQSLLEEMQEAKHTVHHTLRTKVEDAVKAYVENGENDDRGGRPQQRNFKRPTDDRATIAEM